MNDQAIEFHGARILCCAPEGPLLRENRDVTDLVAAGWQAGAQWMVLPVARLGDEFFRLRTGIAGEIIQKFVTYHFNVAILGDISEHVACSTALSDFVVESNRGKQVWFVADLDELAARIKAMSATE